MCKFVDRLQEILKALLPQHEGIATTQDDLLEGVISADHLQRRLQLARRCALLRVGVVPAEAVATVDGAGAGGDQECATCVLLEQPGTPGAGQVPHGVRTKARG